jgi:DNA-binding response OmpR family regulator
MNGGEARPRRVLVIEDDQVLRKMYTSALRDEGFEVIEAHNGLQAMEKATDLLPDAIVTDLNLPGIDGFELCRRLHRTPSVSGLPIVAITGRYLSEADVQRALREGCRTVLIKPFRIEELAAEVRRAIGGA